MRLDPTLGSEIKKTRPCVVMTTDILNRHRRTVVVIPLSSSPEASPPLLIPVICAGQRAVAVLDQIRAVSKERLYERMGALPQVNMQALEAGLREILEL